MEHNDIVKIFNGGMRKYLDKVEVIHKDNKKVYKVYDLEVHTQGSNRWLVYDNTIVLHSDQMDESSTEIIKLLVLDLMSNHSEKLKVKKQKTLESLSKRFGVYLSK